jgi:hypothetical protein
MDRGRVGVGGAVSLLWLAGFTLYLVCAKPSKSKSKRSRSRLLREKERERQAAGEVSTIDKQPKKLLLFCRKEDGSRYRNADGADVDVLSCSVPLSEF